MHRLGETIDLVVLKGILSTVLDGVIVADPAGQIIDCSDLASSIFGYQKHELIGQSMDAAIIPEDHRKATARVCKGFVRAANHVSWIRG